MSVFPDSPDEGQHPRTDDDAQRSSGNRAVVGWAVGLMLTAVAVVVAIWQVNEQLYTPQYTTEQYWEAVTQGEGDEALGHFSETPEFLADEQLDHLLLDGAPLARSAELIEAPEVGGDADAAQLQFTAGSEDYTTAMPVTHTGTTWGFFDNWGMAANGLTWFEVEVPGAPQGGIGQLQVNGDPVNLDEETAQLSAFVPSAAEITVDSQWLVGSTSHVVAAADESGDSAQRVTLDLEASEDAVEMLHQEVSEFFDRCDQAVLMPAGCPVGISTPHRVDAETIDWTFPDAEEFSLGFDADGWQAQHDQLVAEVSFEATHHHTGESITETEEVPFDLTVEVGASGEDLIVAVRGE